MTAFVTLLRRARTLLWTALSIVIITCAVLVGLGKLLMPYSANYKPQLEAWLSGEFERTVTIDSFSGQWRAFGPRLTVNGLRLSDAGGGEGAAIIEEAVIDIKPFNALIPSRALYEFRVVGADFHLAHLEDGTFEFSGLGVRRRSGQSGSALENLSSISEVILQDSSLRYDDEIHDIHVDLRAINGRLQVRGNELAAEIGFRLAHGAGGSVSGELEATTRLTLDESRRPLTARWQLSGQELMLGELRDQLPKNAWFPRQGRLNAEFWGDWNRERQHHIRGVADLRNARLVSDQLDWSVERINTRFQWRFSDANEWRLDLADFMFEDEASEWSVASLAVGRSMSAGVGLWLGADRLPVSTPAAIARDVVRAAGKNWPRFIPGAGQGEVRNFELVLNRNMKLGTAVGIIKNASVSEWGIWPDISNIDGWLEFGPGRQGSLTLNGREVLVEWPRMFDAPLTVGLPHCRVNFTWTAVKGEYQVVLPDCGVESPFVSARSTMRFAGNAGKPAVDVMVDADRLDASAAGPYWPRALLKETAVNWLQDSLLEGQLESGKLQIRGDMDQWPFDKQEGRFEAVAHIRDAEVAYFEGWPAGRQVDGTVRFVNTSMDVTAQVGEIGGVQDSEVHASVSDFREAELLVEYSAESDLPGFLGFLRQSPVGARFGEELSRYGFEGPATTAGTLRVPLRKDSPGPDLQGRLDLRDNVFRAGILDFELAAISGSVRYDESGFAGEDLAAEYLGEPARLSFEAGGEAPPTAPAEGAPDDGAGRLTATLAGAFDVADIVPPHLLETWPPLLRITGRSEWEARLTSGGDRPAEISLTSLLKGVTSDLPAPLKKPSEVSWPFSLRVPLTGDPRLLRITVTDRLDIAFSMGEGWETPHRAAIELGPGEAVLPDEGLLSVGGRADVVDLDGWVAVIIDQTREGKGLGGLTLESGSLFSQDTRFLDRRFEAVDLQLSASDGTLNANFDAAAIDGTVTFITAAGGSQSLNAEFERLVLDKPLTSGMEMDVDPARLPALHLYAKSFRYSGAELGETRIEAYPTSEGFHFEKVEAESPHMSVRASGDWLLEDGAHRSNFDIHMASESLGDFLRQLGIASPVEGGQTLVDFGVWWEGTPGQFALARLNGTVNFSVNTGAIRDASPGSGRLLGLLSVQALPRRLALDFRDVFDSGFSFDEANGSFTMLNGSARTDDVTLKSSAASITFSGTTDLVERQYDQLITVRPGLGNTLPVIGAIAGGPGGAAAGLALQGLLHDELGEASQVQYTLTGAWDDPSIEPVLKNRADG